MTLSLTIFVLPSFSSYISFFYFILIYVFLFIVFIYFLVVEIRGQSLFFAYFFSPNVSDSDVVTVPFLIHFQVSFLKIEIITNRDIAHF